MRGTRQPRIVVLGMITKMPVGGVLWQTLHYLVGLQRLGCDVWYVEAHARTPSSFVRPPDDTGSRTAAAFLAGVMDRFGMGDRWAFHALHDDGSCYGMSVSALTRLYESADLILNLHGGTEPRVEHAANGRLVFIATDPVELEIELANGRQSTYDLLDAHCAFFTFGENYGRPTCRLPVTNGYDFKPTRQPVVLDFWSNADRRTGGAYTTIANWKQRFRTIRFQGETYTWSKHHEFRKVLDLPQRSGRHLELALSSIEDTDRKMLSERGWHVRDALEFSYDMDAYRAYIRRSRGEFTVAKDQNVRFRSGWFSDRSATYLAAGLPVVTQETGFSEILPTGHGLFGFSDIEQACAALDTIETDYASARKSALEVARGWFSHEAVLEPMLRELGVRPPAAGRTALTRSRESDLPPDLVLTPRARRPVVLEARTLAAMRERPLPRPEPRPTRVPRASVVIVTYDNADLTRLCIESVLATTRVNDCELIIIDNASTDGTRDYLQAIATRSGRVHICLNERNEGFARGCNMGLERATGSVLVLLNNDTIVPPGWLDRLADHLSDPELGAINPATNRIGTESEVATVYETYREFLDFDAKCSTGHRGRRRPVSMVAMFCMAMRRDAYQAVGPLDESFGVGLFEDDDYSVRMERAGFRLACAEDVVVHHFGEASFGKLFESGTYSDLFERNRTRFETKWGRSWRPHGREEDRAYTALIGRIRSAVAARLPAGVTLAVVSRGDDRLLEFGRRAAMHFPRGADGGFAGHYPADDGEALAQLEAVRCAGAEYLVVPRPAFWWLEYYSGFSSQLHEVHGGAVFRNDDVVVFRVGLAGARLPEMEGVA